MALSTSDCPMVNAVDQEADRNAWDRNDADADRDQGNLRARNFGNKSRQSAQKSRSIPKWPADRPGRRADAQLSTVEVGAKWLKNMGTIYYQYMLAVVVWRATDRP